jgi:hypothetical protein
MREIASGKERPRNDISFLKLRPYLRWSQNANISLTIWMWF